MKVIAIEKGFYGQLRQKGDEFTITPYSDKTIIGRRKEKSDKKVTDAERKLSVDEQFGSWMEEVKAKKTTKED